MKPHPFIVARHTTPSGQATRLVANAPPQAASEQTPAPTAGLSRLLTNDSGKLTFRRLHRKQAAGYLGVSLSWLDKSRLRGDGPAFLQVGGRVIYDVQDLDSYLKSCRRQSTSEPR